MRGTYLRIATVSLFAFAAILIPATVLAAVDPTLTQTVNQGTLSANIMQSDSTTPVTSPSVAFSAQNMSFSCQTSTATMGDTNNRLKVTNLATNNGWTLTIAATSGVTATWTNGTNTYDFNDAAGTGCTAGQMSIDPSVATLTLDCNSSCSAAAITKGSAASFVSGTTNSITLMTSSNGSPWAGYLTGVGLSQKIPASQPEGSYTLGMTLTVTAN